MFCTRSLVGTSSSTPSACFRVVVFRQLRSASTTCGKSGRFMMQQRNFMSTHAAFREENNCNNFFTAPHEDQHSHMMLILGKPGGGKGTISGKILKDFPKFKHMSTGDILRQHVRSQTRLGMDAKEYMDRGELVPDKLIIEVVMEDATPYLENGRSLLLDGFPRTVKQAQALEEVAHIDMVVNLDVPDETIVDRIADRWIHPASGRIYSYSYKPPKVEGQDDLTGEPLVQRDDDKPDAVRQRLASYDKVTAPLVGYYESRGILCETFSGTRSDEIYPRVKSWLEKHF